MLRRTMLTVLGAVLVGSLVALGWTAAAPAATALAQGVDAALAQALAGRTSAQAADPGREGDAPQVAEPVRDEAPHDEAPPGGHESNESRIAAERVAAERDARRERAAAKRAAAERAEAKREARQERAEKRALERAQRRLARGGYYFAAIDGEVGPATISATMAFQKVNRLTVDGVIGPQTDRALRDPVSPELRGGESTRIEVDLDHQVLYFVTDDRLRRVMPVSSGSGEPYTTSSGATATSRTPVGTFRIERRIDGVRKAPLGTLYDPLYYYGGWAIHGSGSVPAYPASHGCVRVSLAEADWLFERAPVGTQVIVHGGDHTFSPSGSLEATTGGAGA